MVMVAGEQFADDTACLICVHVWAGEPVKLASRDDEAEWQFLCGRSTHEAFEARVVSLEEAVALDRRLAELEPMEVGELRSL